MKNLLIRLALLSHTILWLHPPVLIILFVLFSILRLCGIIVSWWPAGWALFGALFFIIWIRVYDTWLNRIIQSQNKNADDHSLKKLEELANRVVQDRKEWDNPTEKDIIEYCCGDKRQGER